jgi:predicted RNA binding protein YcfA (HicA-like mRNA interferase family)
MTVREILKVLNKHGWYEVAQSGSHRQFKHPILKGKVTVPIHNGDMGIRTLKSILAQAGLRMEDL